MVAIEFGMWRSGLIGGASGSVAGGNGKVLEQPARRNTPILIATGRRGEVELAASREPTLQARGGSMGD
jgi:hypothetical protein